MKRLRGPQDTIVRWIALTIALGMVILVGLNALFIEVAGVWALPSLSQAGLLEQAAALTRVLNAAPSELRPQLIRAASNGAFVVNGYADHQELGVPQVGNPIFHGGAPLIRELTNSLNRQVEAYGPSDWPAGTGPGRYELVVQLDDGSWLSFIPPTRSWGLPPGIHNTVIILLGLIAALLVAWLTTRRLAGPLKRFAKAAKRFGGDFQAPAIALEGPYEIRQAISAFNAMQAQIQHFVADRTQMLTAISHDLRAPLTRMRLRGEFIDDPDQQRKLFRDVDEMQSMINAALAFFRDDVRLEQATPFDLAELIHTLIDDYHDQGLAVDFTGPGKLAYLGRPLGIRRVVTNLLDNAVKYAETLRIDLTANDAEVVIEVTDRGPGIPEALREKVFEPFFRLETSRNRNTGGVGLGLSAARAIVLEHGGQLSLLERPGGGLIARVQLPR